MRCLGILFVGFALSAGNQTPKDKQEQPPSIVGKWKVVGMILNAREQPPEAFDQLIYVIRKVRSWNLRYESGGKGRGSTRHLGPGKR